MLSIESFFAGAPDVRESAPGRVNLLGEHTDYDDGFMLPVATPQRTEVALGRSIDGHFNLYSSTLDASARFARAAAAPPGFARYIEGCIRMVEAEGITVPPLRVYVSTGLPVGSGLSSSAALEVAMLRALRTLLGLPFDDVMLARMAQQAEIAYAKVNCAIMDQMASSLADTGHMLFIDARTLAHRLQAMPPETELIVIDSGVPRTLAGSKYNERRAQCEAAARTLGVPTLRDVADPATVETLPSPLRARAPRGARKPAGAGSGRRRRGGPFWRTDERLPRQPARRLRRLDSGARLFDRLSAGPAQGPWCPPDRGRLRRRLRGAMPQGKGGLRGRRSAGTF